MPCQLKIGSKQPYIYYKLQQKTLFYITKQNFIEEGHINSVSVFIFLLTNPYSISLILVKMFGEHIGKYISSKNIDINNLFVNLKTLKS
ncbi:hypothetical protein C1H87_20515 [Flavivirga eckloniae]|uniref:Uncharacterized protein n=1 Tax=Flavivirga eckloniae TaxID=1803846 RepID=A0A2K9PV79_9FLAO|nr:hypothetical protein C1H87_20515 [Flavivirga eckloniae]